MNRRPIPRSQANTVAAIITGSILLSAAGWAAEATPPPAAPEFVKQLDLIHFSHTDYGFTDHPAVCRDMQRRYLDIALDAARATAAAPEETRFRWTAETTVAVHDWWQSANPERRQQFLQAVKAGQLEVTALPLNNTPFLSRDQWQVMAHWLPEELWKEVRPQTAVQNDVNGFPRAGALALLDRGVRYLFAGINSDSGGPPLPRLSAFWWKMPDGRRLFVYLSLSYGDGFFLFEPEEWRRGPVPLAADARYRPPRAGDFLRPDEAAVRAAQRHCVQRLRQIEKDGYRHAVLAVSLTNMWRYDNDPPFPPLADFAAAWNRLGLQPRLRLVTVTGAMQNLEQALGATAPEHAGEWTDWWANGTASAPREVAASRAAKRFLAAAQSPVWGPLDDTVRRRIDELTQDICLFDEHTWGSSMSVALPYSLDSQGQFNEKARLAFRPMALAEWLLAQRARTRLIREAEGLWLANPAPEPFSGWATMISTCLRDKYQSVVDPATGRRERIHFEPGVQPWGRPQQPTDLSREDVSAVFPDQSPNRWARFWVERLDAHAVRRLQLSTEAVQEQPPQPPTGPTVSLDHLGWPVSATWNGMKKPLFTAGLGDFVAVQVNAFTPRWALRDIWENKDPARGEQLRNGILEQVPATPGDQITVEQTPHTIRYTQPVLHPRLAWATRRLELWRNEPRARLTFRLNRRSSFDPEMFCIASPLPCDGVLPRLSCGGQPFTPFTDQLPGSCRDYYAVDGWAHYAAPEGHWLWVSRDAPLIMLDGPHVLARLNAPPPRTARVLAMVYNNFWYTNFVGDSPGVMEFQFDLAWRERVADDATAEKLAAALVAEPVMLINPKLPEQPLFLQHLYKP
jgi:hypothetical protein